MLHLCKRVRGLLLLAAIALLTGALHAAPATGAMGSAGADVPDGLSAGDWRSIRRQVELERYAVQAGDGGAYRADNPAHGLEVRYHSDGNTQVSPRDGEAEPWRVGLRLAGIGYQRLHAVTEPESLSADDQRLTYRWGEGLTEWWVNTPSGLEQWFELAAPPADRPAADAPLIVSLALDSSLEASVRGQGDDQHLHLHDAGTTVRFEKLRVFDADGRRVPARLQLDGRELAYVIDDRRARYPLTIDPTFVQQAYLKASNTDEDDEFGLSVAVAGDTVVVGALYESSNATGVDGNEADNSATYAGAAYVFVRDGTGTWSQQAYLKASNTDAGDLFGTSVAVAGDTLVVGASLEDSNATGVDGNEGNDSATSAGAAYVFVRDGTGNWSQQAYLKASNTNAGDSFGVSVAVASDTVVVGALYEDSDATGVDGNEGSNLALSSGAAYVFVRDGTSTWSQQAYLKASNTDVADSFGQSVALAGDTLVVGARYEDSDATGVDGNEANNSADNAGAAYVFVRDGTGTWSQQAYLKASNTDELDTFGSSVAIAGDTLVVGALQEDSNATGVDGNEADNSAGAAGAAYVFVRDGTSTWSQQAYLKASNNDASDTFGNSVAVSGDAVVVGATGERSNATGVDGNEGNDSAPNSGAAYVFARDGTGNWSQQAYLKASNTGEFDQFGRSVALAGDTVVAGAPREGSSATGVDGNELDNLAGRSGAAYVFDLATFTVGGTLSGLEGDQVVLQNNGGDDLTINTDGAFTFPTALAGGSAYNVTVATHPSDPSQTCSVVNGSGTISGANVTNVEVDCSTDQFTVGGTVSGLEGDQVVLQNNGGDDLSIAANGAFSFATALDDLSGYAVTVVTQPTGPIQTCTVSNGSGTLNGADITDVQVTCTTDQFTVGGTVTGLSGSGLLLQNNGADDLSIAANGAFTFANALDDLSGYAVTVATQPSGLSQTCTASNGSGTLNGADITNVQVTCTIDQFAVGGTLSGLEGDQVVLQNNGGDDQVVTADGSFTFTAQNDGSAYNVTVATQPSDPSQTCSVVNGSGTLSGAPVTAVQVDCSTDQFTVGGTLSGLEGDQVVLQNNSADDLTITADGAFTFPTALDDGSAYDIAVLTQPDDPSQTCSVVNGSDTLSGADVTNVEVTCSADQFTVGGTLSGLEGDQVVLQNNSGDDLTITADGAFTFPTALADGSAYDVTVATQPSDPSQTCTVANASGTVSGANITDVEVTCVTDPSGIGLSPSSLDFGVVDIEVDDATTATVTVTNTGTDDLTISALTGPGAPFAVTGGSCLPVPTTLLAAEDCDIEVEFAPDAPGTFNAVLGIESNAPSSPDEVSMSGSALLSTPLPALGRFGQLLLMLMIGLIGMQFARRANAFR